MVEKEMMDILWVLICVALVFLMQAGFLCLETGLTRSKNNINVAIKNLTDFGIAFFLFWAVGYAIMFGSSAGGWFGISEIAPNFADMGSWPTAFLLFHAMFCTATVIIVSGAVAERLRFHAYIVIAILITILIYPVFGHWVWNGAVEGKVNGWLGNEGFIDFAGSTAVHSVGGWVSLAILLVIGPRIGRFPKDGSSHRFPAANLPMTALGVILLWIGWMGFNGGSTLAFDENVPLVIANTILAGAAGMMGALAFGWIKAKRADVDFVLNGSLAGLVAISAGSPYVSSLSAVIIGLVAGVVMIEVTYLLEKKQIDDAVGAIPVHLGPGIWGTLAVALFGDRALLDTGLDHWEQLGVQFLGIVICFLWAFGLTYVLVRAVAKVIPLRVTPENERIGLNVAEHGKKTAMMELFETMDKQAKTEDLSLRVPVDAYTEVGQVAERYNTVMAKLEDSTGRLKDYQLHLEELVEVRTKEMKESEEKFHSLYRSMDEGVALNELILDDDGVPVDYRILDMNKAYERLLFLKREDVVGSLASEIYGSGEAPYLDIFSVAAQSREPVSFETYFEPLDRHFSVSAFTPSKNKFATLFFDITNLKQAEKLISKQKEMYQTTLESLTYPFYVVNVEDYSIRMANSAAKKLERSGTSRCYALTHGREKPCDSQDNPCPLEIIKKTLKPVVVEHVHYDEEGDPGYAEVHGYPIFDEDGNLIQMIEYSLDITERKKMEGRLKEAADTIRKQWELLEKELNAGNDIQMSMLRTDFPEPPKCQTVSLFASLEPAKEVGGDFYDFFFIDEHRLCINVGDVSDKGVPAALFMALTKALIKSRASEDPSPASIVSHVNNEVSSQNEQNMFITAFVSILDVRTGELSFTNAGHNPPYIKTRDGATKRLAKRHGPVIGAMPKMTYGEEKVQLNENDYLFLYTDGVTEAMNSKKQLFSEKRLAKLLKDETFDSPHSIIDTVLADIKNFVAGADQSDDITVLTMKYLKSSKEVKQQ